MFIKLLDFININLHMNRKSDIVQSPRLFPQLIVFQGSKIVDEGKLFIYLFIYFCLFAFSRAAPEAY